MQANNFEFAVLAVEQRKQGGSITPENVRELLKDVHGVTFAKITQVTRVALAAAHKAIEIHKVTVASVQLFNNLSEFTNVYEAAVKRSAAAIGSNNVFAVEDFKPQASYFDHTDCYSLTKHKTQDKYYLFAIYNDSSKSIYIKDGVEMTKEAVATYMTPSASKELLKEDTAEPAVHNKENDIKHNVIVRTVGLENIVEITAMGKTLYV